MITPSLTLRDVALRQIFEECRRVIVKDSANKNLAPSRHTLKETERLWNKHLLGEVISAATSIPYLSYVHCEPQNIEFADLPLDILGKRSFKTICLNKAYHNDPILPSVLTHEAVHIIGAEFQEETTVLLGWETDARLIQRGNKLFEASLYRSLRDALIHVSLLKAHALGKTGLWKKFIKESCNPSATDELLDSNIYRLLNGEEENIFGERLSDYSLIPYLSIVDAIRGKRTFILDEYESFDGAIKRDRIDIPELVKMWRQTVG